MLSRFARDIKISHSIFALPFALLATFLAAGSQQRWPSVVTVTLIVVCMVLARTVAMAVNRWADAKIDAGNPRTAGRAIPSGAVSSSFMLGMAVGCSLAFVIATAGFWLFNGNVWPLVLSPAVLAYLALYSYCKRFTWTCHLVLGGALALSPLAAVIAVEPGYLASAVPWLLAAMVLCWVAGFDVIYALQDVGFDREVGLFSMPASLGVEPALWVSRLLHVGAVAAIVMAGQLSAQLGLLFSLAVGGTVGLLLLEHALVWRSKTHHIHMAFFTLNGIISVLLGIAGIVDVLRGL